LVAVADFNDDLARATLLERPNSFFTGTVAPEDVDSDSGYSSPQHRQTTAAPSDSALPLAGPVPAVPPPLIVPSSPQPASRVLEATQNVPQQQAVMTYMPDGRHLPMIYAPYPFHGPASANMFLPTAKRPVDTRRAQSASHHHSSGAKMRHRGSGNRKPSKPQSTTPKPPTDNQSTSVNASQVTACSEPALPFDDVDEFPYLLSAAGGLVASQVSSGHLPPNQLITCRPVEVVNFLQLILMSNYCDVILSSYSSKPLVANTSEWSLLGRVSFNGTEIAFLVPLRNHSLAYSGPGGVFQSIVACGSRGHSALS